MLTRVRTTDRPESPVSTGEWEPAPCQENALEPSQVRRPFLRYTRTLLSDAHFRARAMARAGAPRSFILNALRTRAMWRRIVAGLVSP